MLACSGFRLLDDTSCWHLQLFSLSLSTFILQQHRSFNAGRKALVLMGAALFLGCESKRRWCCGSTLYQSSGTAKKIFARRIWWRGSLTLPVADQENNNPNHQSICNAQYAIIKLEADGF